MRIGQKCVYRDAYGFRVVGAVLSIQGNKITVYDGKNAHERHGESMVEFQEKDIGTKLNLFEEE